MPNEELEVRRVVKNVSCVVMSVSVSHVVEMLKCFVDTKMAQTLNWKLSWLELEHFKLLC